MAALKRFTKESLQILLNDIYQKYGFSKADSQQITEILLQADMAGIPSHGVQRLNYYDGKIKSGQIKVDNQAEVIKETSISAVLDGHSAMGHLVGKVAMDLAIQKAQLSGIGIVTVRNSNHYGIAGYYAELASKAGLIGMSLTNSRAIMVPTNASQPYLGTNPVAFGMSGVDDSFLFDAATTTVSYGKVQVYEKRGLDHPEIWTLSDYDSSFTSNTKGLAPLGGFKEASGSHKGFGLGLVVELLTGILSGGATSDQISENGGICHFFLAIDPTLFGDKEAIEKSLDAYLERLRNADRLDAEIPIFVPGDKEKSAEEANERQGIPVDDVTIAEIQAIAQGFNIDFPTPI